MHSIILLILGLSVGPLFAREQVFRQIDVCYHWLGQDQLDVKIAHAKANHGELLFYNNRPIYCWRSPIGGEIGWEPHGSEMIRIKFKPNVTIKHVVRSQTPAWDNIFLMMQAGVDVYYDNSNPWHEYVFSPSAVESWSIYEPETINEMKSDYRLLTSAEVSEDDVHYPWVSYDLNYIKRTVYGNMVAYEQKSKQKLNRIFGSFPEKHFDNRIPLKWNALDDAKIRIFAATYEDKFNFEDVRDLCSDMSIQNCLKQIQEKVVKGAPRFSVAYDCSDNKQQIKVIEPGSLKARYRFSCPN